MLPGLKSQPLKERHFKVKTTPNRKTLDNPKVEDNPENKDNPYTDFRNNEIQKDVPFFLNIQQLFWWLKEGLTNMSELYKLV